MLRQSQLSTFASITEWFHGSALRLSEDDGRGFYSCGCPAGGQHCNPFSIHRHPRGNATINPTVVILGLDPRAHTVMLRQSQLSTFASITEWFHGSALRLSEDDVWGI